MSECRSVKLHFDRLSDFYVVSALAIMILHVVLRIQSKPWIYWALVEIGILVESEIPTVLHNKPHKKQVVW